MNRHQSGEAQAARATIHGIAKQVKEMEALQRHFTAEVLAAALRALKARDQQTESPWPHVEMIVALCGGKR